MRPPRLLHHALVRGLYAIGCCSLVAGAAFIPREAGAEGLAFLINSNEASVSLFDVTTRTELRRIPVLREPHHMALTPDGKSLLIGDIPRLTENPRPPLRNGGNPILPPA